MYSFEISEKADREFRKLKKKDPKQLKIIKRKISQILDNPYHFKPLRGDLHGARRVHISKSFVMTYEIIEKERKLRILDYAHHDMIY